MFYATAPVATDIDIHEPVLAVLRGAAAAVRAAVARHRDRKGYRQLLERDDAYLRDIGVTRGQVRQVLSGC